MYASNTLFLHNVVKSLAIVKLHQDAYKCNCMRECFFTMFLHVTFSLCTFQSTNTARVFCYNKQLIA